VKPLESSESLNRCLDLILTPHFPLKSTKDSVSTMPLFSSQPIPQHAKQQQPRNSDQPMPVDQLIDWPSQGYAALAQSLGWRSTLKDYLTNEKWQSKAKLRRELGVCHRCGKPKEEGVYCQRCYDEIFLEHRDPLDRRLADFD
jgi:hypothetical protein